MNINYYLHVGRRVNRDFTSTMTGMWLSKTDFKITQPKYFCIFFLQNEKQNNLHKFRPSGRECECLIWLQNNKVNSWTVTFEHLKTNQTHVVKYDGRPA